MKKLISLVLTVALTVVGCLGMSVIGAEEVGAIEFEGMTKDASCEHSILGLKPWYAGLVGKKGGTCVVGTPKEKDMPLFVWTIVLNVLADLFIVVGYLAIGFVIYGGVLYIMSAGDPGKVARGKQVLTSAAIGLVVSILATVVVNIITAVLSGAVTTS